jgi:putative mRNA 3-end processing factor
LNIKILGGGQEVGRSGILIEGNKNILLDYGIKVEEKVEYPMSSGRVDAFVLSHAHLDHSGFSPTLYHSGMPPSFGTAPTKALAELLIEDAIRVQKMKHNPSKYKKTELRSFLNSFITYNYRSQIDFHDYTISLHNAGHISGSSITKIENNRNGRKLVYTGDFKLAPQLLQNGAEVVESDVLVIESTYAIKEHPDRNNLIKLFVENIKEVVENNGIALIPVFAVGRSQEVLAILEKHKLTNYTYLDGMAKAATRIALEHQGYMHNPELLSGAVSKVTTLKKDAEREEAISGGSIIVTTSGMLTGGPVLNYLTKLNDKSMIFLTGYQAEGTNGRKLLDNNPLDIDNRKVFIKTPFSFYDLSAHAGQADIYDYVKRSDPETVVCVHGDKTSTLALKDWLEMEGFEAYAPKNGDSIKIEL